MSDTEATPLIFSKKNESSVNIPNSNSSSSQSGHGVSLSNTNKHSKRSSIGSNNMFNVSQMSKPGTRASMVSDYSGIIQQVDIDTVKYIGNKESLQLSGLTSSEESLNMNANNDNDDATEKLNLEIPNRSIRRSSTPYNIDTDSISKLINKSPNKSVISSSSKPPSSPLPKLSKHPHSTTSSPLKKKQNRRFSNDSTSSLRLHGKLNNIMKEMEDMKMEFDDEPSKSITGNRSNSTVTSLYTTNSFHTANSENSTEKQDFKKPQNDEDTVHLHLHSRTLTLDPSIRTIQDEHERPVIEGSSKYIPMMNKTDSVKTHSKTASSVSYSTATKSHHHQQSKNSSSSRSHKSKSSSSKSKRKSATSTSSKNKIKPFSYDTLAKLLNATDGIIIGQEFATLNIPAEEKFLIERIVDSISRLTANMMLNPSRYDQSCARLEHVLNVLEGFE